MPTVAAEIVAGPTSSSVLRLPESEKERLDMERTGLEVVYDQKLIEEIQKLAAGGDGRVRTDATGRVLTHAERETDREVESVRVPRMGFGHGRA